MNVTLRHTGTGHLRVVDTGWSWSLFLASGFLGLPLFFRGLALWGTVMLAAWTLSLGALVVDSTGGGTGMEMLDWGLTLIVGGLCAFFGLKGNALAARRYLSLGYDFVNPDSADAREAARSWGL